MCTGKAKEIQNLFFMVHSCVLVNQIVQHKSGKNFWQNLFFDDAVWGALMDWRKNCCWICEYVVKKMLECSGEIHQIPKFHHSLYSCETSLVEDEGVETNPESIP